MSGLENFRVDIDKNGTSAWCRWHRVKRCKRGTMNGPTICETAARLQALCRPYRRGAHLLPPHLAADVAAGVAVQPRIYGSL